MKKERKTKIKSKSSLIIVLLFIAAFAFMTIGFARYNKIVNLQGNAIVKPDGKIYIKSVTLDSKTESAAADPFVTEDGAVNFNLSFQTNNNAATQYQAVFKITIANESSYDYAYNVPDYVPTVTKDGVTYTNLVDYQITGISVGEKILAETEKILTATFTFTNPSLEDTGLYEVDGNFTPDLVEHVNERIIAVVDNSVTGDLRGSNNLARFSVNVVSTYTVDKTFTIVADSDKYVARNLTDTGTPSYTITANNPGQDFDFYLKKVDGAVYSSSSEKVKILLVPTGMADINTGRVTVLVDVTVIDTEAPQISNVTASVENTEGSISVSWTGTDDSGSIETYTILAYNQSGTKIDEKTIQADTNSTTFTNLAEGTYYFVVYGEDSSGNTATSAQISSATTSQGEACKSSNIEAKWNFTVTYQTDGHVNYTGGNTAKRGEAYTTRLTTNNTNNYNNPTADTISITMGGTNFTNYSFNNNTVTINPPITGNIVINVTAPERTGTCFAEGTRILLANDTYKNIEDIKYTDLLKVYDHVNGGTTDVYPIWLEKEDIADEYVELTFSDNTNLKIVHKHSVFDVDKKRYINVTDSNECKIGTRIYKLKNNKLEIVTITNIEYKHENVKRYNIVSTNYYNVIANDVLTTDLSTSVSNVYGFEENAIYGENFYKMQEKKSLPYLFVCFVPHYLYKGLNLEHAKAFLEANLDIKYIIDVISKSTVEPITKNGKRYFMATTSLDIVNNEEEIEKHLYKEGSYFVLPEKGAKYFVDTFTNKIYKPGEKIKVECSIHLKAVK